QLAGDAHDLLARVEHSGPFALHGDETGDGLLEPGSQSGEQRGRVPGVRAQPGRREVKLIAHSEDQTSIFVPTRPITLSVNSVVPAWPPRSGVRTPAAIASSAPS